MPCPDGDFEETIRIQSKYDGRRTIPIQPENFSLVLKPEELSPLRKAALQRLRYRNKLKGGMVKTVTEPKAPSMAKLRKGFPDDWEEQRKLFGIR